MGSIKDEASVYEESKARNISELPKIPVGLAVEEFSGVTTDENGEEKPFKYKFFEFEGNRYRLPVSVLKQLKAQLDENLDLEFFKVRKSGEGLKTEYTVIPLL